MRRAIVHALAASVLAACASKPNAPWRADIEACHKEAAVAPRIESTPQKLAYVNRCMAAKGWRATPACLELRMEGTTFCDYAR